MERVLETHFPTWPTRVKRTVIGNSLKFNIRAHCALLASQVLELELSRDKCVFIEDVVW